MLAHFAPNGTYPRFQASHNRARQSVFKAWGQPLRQDHAGKLKASTPSTTFHALYGSNLRLFSASVLPTSSHTCRLLNGNESASHARASRRSSLLLFAASAIRRFPCTYRPERPRCRRLVRRTKAHPVDPDGVNTVANLTPLLAPHRTEQ